MPSQHARLSPSSSERWINCPASVRLAATVPAEGESAYAREGTLAHGLAEILAGQTFGLHSAADTSRKRRAWRREFDAEGYPAGTLEEMTEHCMDYVDLIRERRPEGSALFLEQRMDSGVEACWGTSDTVIVAQDHVKIIDFKYGQGVPVSAERNSQLRLYGLGALATYGDVLGTTEHVTMTVHQPRLRSVSSETLTVAELRQWRDEVVKPAAYSALHAPYAPFGPSEAACRWCPMSGRCAAQLAYTTGEDFGDLTQPGELPPPPEAATLSPEDLAHVLNRLGAVKDWLTAVDATAMSMIYREGKRIPGYKVVMSSGRRSITDHAAFIQRAIDAGFPAEQVSTIKAKGLTELTKLMGRDTFDQVGEGLVARSPGKESLVPATDKRPSISAADDFRD